MSHYQRAWLRPDVLAGLTLTVVLVPQAMAYASLAGLPPVTGLYAAAVALLVYAAVGTSPHLSFGPFAVVSLLTAAAVEPLAQGDTARAVALAGVLALMVAAIHLLLGLLRAGAVVNLISHPVVIGFTGAVALIIALTQVRDLLGADIGRSALFTQAVASAVEAVPQAHLATVAIGVGSVVLLLLGQRFAPKMPTALLICVVGIGMSVGLGLEDRGVATIGHIPSGLPQPVIPPATLDALSDLAAAAVVIAVISFAGNASLAKAIATRTHEHIDPNRELLASGAANAAAGLFGGFPVAASYSRTVVVRQAGARTQLAGVVAAAALLITLVVLTGLLEPLPRAILAAIVVVAVLGLLDVRGAVNTFRVDRLDGLVLVATFVATLVVGVELGLLAGVALNVGAHVARGMRPAISELGRVHGTTAYRNVERYPTVTVPHGVVLRLDGPLNFLSVDEVTGRLRTLAAERPALEWVVLDVSGVTGMDSTGVHALRGAQQDLAAAGIALHLATLRGPQRDIIARAGLWGELIGGATHVDVPAALAALGLSEDSPLRSPARDEVPPDDLL